MSIIPDGISVEIWAVVPRAPLPPVTWVHLTPEAARARKAELDLHSDRLNPRWRFRDLGQHRAMWLLGRSQRKRARKEGR